MFDIAKYLEKFKLMSQSKFFLRDSVAETIKEVCKIEVDKSKILINDYTDRLNEKHIIKTEIFIKKIKILEILDNKTNGKIKNII